MKKPAILAACALCSGLFYQSAWAVEPLNIPAERFGLSLDHDGILGLEWAALRDHLSWDLALWVGGADDPVVLFREGEEAGALVGTRISGGIVGSLGLTNFLQLGLEIPLVLFQSGTTGAVADLDASQRAGVGSVRVGAKLRVLDQDHHGVYLSILPVLILPTAQRDRYFGEPTWAFSPQMLLGRIFGPVKLGLNLGVHIRTPSSFVNLAIRNELTARLGVSVSLADLGAPLTLDASLQAATPIKDPLSSPHTYLEMLFGASYHAGPVKLFAAAGPGLASGYGTPDWRALVGIRLFEMPSAGRALGPLRLAGSDTDGDGIEDAFDLAPNVPEDVDGHEDLDGVPDPDDDGDGVLDPADRCKHKPGPLENHGCPAQDSDGDGVADHLDKCPTQPEDLDGFEDLDGCGELDDDGDGIADTVDRCPEERGVEDNQGCPDFDRDRDGIVDRLDTCPDQPGTQRNRGCSRKPKLFISEGRINIQEKISFAYGRARIRGRSFELLDQITRVLRSHPEIERLEIRGHTDNRGVPISNHQLSERRASAVRRYLIRRGIEASRLRALGFGQTKPIASNGSSRGRAKNRRVELMIMNENENEDGIGALP